ELLLLLLVERAIVGVAHRREDDPLTVGRVAAFGVVPARVGQALHRAGLFVIRVDIHFRVVVPRVATLFARRAKRELLVLQLLRFRIRVRRRELDLVAAGTEERARRLAGARRDALRLAGAEVEHIDLIEGIPGLTLALKDEPLAVRRPVAFAGAPPFDGEPPNTRQEITLLVGGRGLHRAERRDGHRGD